MRKGRDGEKKREKKGGKKRKRWIKIVATTSLPAVDRWNADRWNAARSRQLSNKLGCWLSSSSTLVLQSTSYILVHFLGKY